MRGRGRRGGRSASLDHHICIYSADRCGEASFLPQPACSVHTQPSSSPSSSVCFHAFLYPLILTHCYIYISFCFNTTLTMDNNLHKIFLLQAPTQLQVSSARAAKRQPRPPTQQEQVVRIPWLPWLATFPAPLVRTTPSLPRSPRQPSVARARLMVATMLILRPSARSSTFAPLTDRVVWPSTASSAPMEPSSTRTTSSATGGSTLIALRLRVSIPRMRKLLPKERLQQVRPPMQLRPHLDIHLGQQPLQMATPRGPCLLWPHRVPRVPMRRLKGPAESLETRERTEMKVSARAENISLSLLCPRAASEDKCSLIMLMLY